MANAKTSTVAKNAKISINDESGKIVDLMKVVKVSSDGFANVPVGYIVGITLLEDQFVSEHQGKPDYQLIELATKARVFTGTVRAFANMYIKRDFGVHNVDTTGQARADEGIMTMREFILSRGSVPKALKCVKVMKVTNWHLVPRDNTMSGIMYPAKCYEGESAYKTSMLSHKQKGFDDDSVRNMEKKIIDQALWRSKLLPKIGPGEAFEKCLFIAQ